jgi:tetratricopeptide (TPR) repeat protein
VKLLDRIVKEFPELADSQADLAHALARLADLLTELGRRQEAEEIRRRTILQYEMLKTNFPDDPVHRRNLVLSYLELSSLLRDLGRPTEAAEPCRKALELDPDNHRVNNQLAWFLASSPEPPPQDTALAVRLAKKAVTAVSQDADYRNTLGVAYYRQGDDKAAVAELKTAMSLRSGGNSFDWFFLAMAHWRLGDSDQAQTWFDRAVKWMDSHTPQDRELHRFRAEAEAMLAGPGKR